MDGVQDPPTPLELHATSQQAHLDFINTDLALCFTFAEVAATELVLMNDKGAAKRALAKAENGHDTLTGFMVRVDDGPQKREMESKLIELRTRLDRLRDLLHAKSSTQL